MSEGGTVSPNTLDNRLNKRLRKQGASKDFYEHAVRRNIVTCLQAAGHSEWQIGLGPQSSGSGVTADIVTGVRSN